MAALPTTMLPPAGALRVKAGCAVMVNCIVVVRTSDGVVLVPVTVTVDVPKVAPAVAVKVMVEFQGLAPTVPGENTAVTPLGNPLMVKFTLLPKPLAGLTVTTLGLPVLLDPAVRDKFVSPPKLKSGGSTVVKFTLAVRVSTGLALVPFTEMLTVPVVAVASAVNVKVDVTLPLATVTEAGLKTAVTPPGKALSIARLTPPVNPLAGVTVIVIGVDPPRTTVAFATLVESEKFALAIFSIAITLLFTRIYSLVCAPIMPLSAIQISHTSQTRRCHIPPDRSTTDSFTIG